MKAPQIIMVAMYAVNLLLAAHMYGKTRETKGSFWTTVVGTGISVGILAWGGFWA